MKTHIAFAAAALLLGAAPAIAQTSGTQTQTSGQAAQALSAEEFVAMAGSSNRLEIESSQLALDRGVTGDVAEFAQQMVADHTKAGETMKEAVSEAGMTPPAGQPDYVEKHAQMLEQLSGAEGDAFTQAYVDMQKMAHEEAVALFSAYAENGEQPALKQFAADTLPTLESHLEHVNMMAGQ